MTFGVLSLAGEAGTVALSCGRWRGGGVDAEAAGRASPGCRRVGGPHAEGVGTVGERRRRGVGARARAGAEGRGAGVDRALEGGARLGAEAKVGVGSLVRPAGPESIWTAGGVVSIVQLKLAGLGSALPAWSIALTSKLWAPSLSSVYCWGRCRAPRRRRRGGIRRRRNFILRLSSIRAWNRCGLL